MPEQAVQLVGSTTGGQNHTKHNIKESMILRRGGEIIGLPPSIYETLHDIITASIQPLHYSYDIQMSYESLLNINNGHVCGITSYLTYTQAG